MANYDNRIHGVARDPRHQPGHASPLHPLLTGPSGLSAIAQSAELRASAIQMRGGGGATADPQSVAAYGLSGSMMPLPHGDVIQAAFGHHDISDVGAHVAGPAAEAAHAMGAQAYATGRSVAFARSPDLHTAAHEAAHVVQQRRGVSLKGGVGESGDAYERHADAVADAVVGGVSAESLLDEGPSGGSATRAVQRKDEPGQRLQSSTDEQAEGGGVAGLLDAQRAALHTHLVSRMGSAQDYYMGAANQVLADLEVEKNARLDCIMALVGVGLIFATPTLGQAIRQLTTAVPQSASVGVHVAAYAMLDHADSVAQAMAQLGRAHAKSVAGAALAAAA